jgi:methyl-accepting chemotaxis protein
MTEQKKSSFAVQFILVVLSTIVLIAGSLSAVFLYDLYSISYSLTRANVEESIGRLQNHIVGSLGRYEDLLDSSRSVATFFDQRIISREDLTAYYTEAMAKVPEVEMLYFANNTKWNLRGGYWVSSPDWTPAADWDQTQRPWFRNAKAAMGEIAYSDPYLDAYTGGIIVSLSRAVYDRQGRDIGVAAMDVLVTELATEVNRSLNFPGQKLYLLNREGLYITNSDIEKVMADNFFKDYGLESHFENIQNSNTFQVTVGDIDFYSVKIPAAEWYLLSIVPRSIITAGINTVLLSLAITGLLVLAAAAVFSIRYTHFMLTVPMQEVGRVAGSLAALDFSVDFEKSKKGDIGEMQQALIEIRDSLKKSFASFGENSSMISTAVYDLSASAKEITTTANEQAASVAEIVSTMESSKNLSAQVASKTIEVAELASQTQEMSQRGANLHEANEDMMADIRDQNAKIVEEIKNLNDVLSGIVESIQLIDSIADRTKLIAFNAALEASSSGEAGSRFAVVAGEIRRFADNVVDSVLEIKDRISELQNVSQNLITEADTGSKAIDLGYNRMVEQKEVFENIVDVSENVAVRSGQISNLSKQQELASAQIFTALKEISAGVKQFVSATASTSVTVENLNSMSIKLKETLALYRINE